jgi:hypothetical protein
MSHIAHANISMPMSKMTSDWTIWRPPAQWIGSGYHARSSAVLDWRHTLI